MCIFSMPDINVPTPAAPPIQDINPLFNRAKKKKLKDTAAKKTSGNELQIPRPEEASVGTGTNNTGNGPMNY